jgi:hypothetical protein
MRLYESMLRKSGNGFRATHAPLIVFDHVIRLLTIPSEAGVIEPLTSARSQDVIMSGRGRR